MGAEGRALFSRGQTMSRARIGLDARPWTRGCHEVTIATGLLDVTLNSEHRHMGHDDAAFIECEIVQIMRDKRVDVSVAVTLWRHSAEKRRRAAL